LIPAFKRALPAVKAVPTDEKFCKEPAVVPPKPLLLEQLRQSKYLLMNNLLFE
jgi:hypothetical protein